jgi:hypothetical protein
MARNRKARHRATGSNTLRRLKFRSMMRRTPACAFVLLILLTACGPGDGADTTPTGSPISVTDTTPSTVTAPDTTTTRPPITDGRSLEGDWYLDGGKMLVVRGETAEFAFGRGPISIDTAVEPNRITLPSDEGERNGVFWLEGGRLQLVLLSHPSAPIPESFEAVRSDHDNYWALELFHEDVVFASGVWVPAGHGLPPQYRVQDMTASGDSLVVGSTNAEFNIDHGLYVSTDRGANWRQAEVGFPTGEPVWALATVGGRIFAGTQSQGVFVSDDGGESWAESNQGLVSPDAECPGFGGSPRSQEQLTFQIADIAGFGSTVYLSNSCGVWRSDDLGDTWRVFSTGLTKEPNASFSLMIGDGFGYATSTSHGVFRLDLEQKGWELVNSLFFPTAIVHSEGTLFAASAVVWRSDDRGDSWEDLAEEFSIQGAKVEDLAAADGNVFAATLRGVFWSGDKGETWDAYNKDLAQNVFFLEVIGGRLIAAASGGVFSAPLPDVLPSPETSGATPGEIPEGFKVFDGSANGFAIALPAEWLAIDLTIGDQDSIAAQLETVFPPAIVETLSSNYVQNRRTTASGLGGLVIVAFAATGDPSLNVTVSPRAPDDTLELEEDMIRAGMESSGGTVESVERLVLSGRQASRIVTVFPEHGVELVQYLIYGEDLRYNISTSSSQPEATAGLLSQIASTFTVADD